MSDTTPKLARLATLGTVTITDDCGDVCVQVAKFMGWKEGAMLPDKAIEGHGTSLEDAVNEVFALWRELDPVTTA